MKRCVIQFRDGSAIYVEDLNTALFWLKHYYSGNVYASVYLVGTNYCLGSGYVRDIPSEG